VRVLVLLGIFASGCSAYLATDGKVAGYGLNVGSPPRDAVRVSAARDLPCSPEDVQVQLLNPRTDEYYAEGCGFRTHYTITCRDQCQVALLSRVATSGSTTAPIAQPVVASQPTTERRYRDAARVEFPSPINGPSGVPPFLRSHAAAFIPCPTEQLSVQALRSGPNPWFSSFLVDGCGKRVAYGLCDIRVSNTQCYTVTSFFALPPGA
jgi:hypothetical protein